MEEITTAIPMPRSTRRRWPLVVGIILMIISLLGLYYCWNRPIHLNQVATFTDEFYDRSLIPFASGFIYQNGPSSFIMRRWNGEPYWTVTVPQSGTDSTDPGFWDMCVSPNGKYMAAVIAVRNNYVLKTWYEGRLKGKYPIPSAFFLDVYSSKVITLNNGNVFLICNREISKSKDDTQALLIKGDKLLAGGHWPKTGFLSPDGACFLIMEKPVSLAAVIVQNGVIRLGKLWPCKSLKDPGVNGFIPAYTLFPLYNHGVAMSRDCTLYDITGNIKQPVPGWERENTISPGSKYTVLIKSSRIRAYCPETGEGWVCHPRNYSIFTVDVTDNGRFMMVWAGRKYPAPIRSLLERNPKWLAHMQLIKDNSDCLLFYEKPGRLRATCTRGEWMSQWISPDGHTIVTEEIGGKISLYRW